MKRPYQPILASVILLSQDDVLTTSAANEPLDKFIHGDEGVWTPNSTKGGN